MMLDKENWNSMLPIVKDVAIETGNFLREEVGRIRPEDIQHKGLHDYVTYVDRKAEELIVDRLRPLLPGAGFMAEESQKEEGTSDLLWVIDPLDGTTNFIHHLPVYAVSIALLKAGKPVLGVVYEANNQECFSSWDDGPSFLNDQVIHVTRNSDLHESLVATGFPYADHSQMPAYLELLGILMKQASGIRRLGSAAVDLAYVACGRFDAFFEYGLKPWDVAAGSLIVRNAGGRVSDFKGKGDGLLGKEIVATNAELFDLFISMTSRAFALASPGHSKPDQKEI